ncbi:lipase member I-like [Cimex lectularius]|uniref:Lipase domain-containing protein n=1 Tax=Cimex lectularius TaxID=79782 RepID=A0A8I6RLH3_CIMLE|nr:lipase member I-like [Cimex lectularius]
MFFEKHSVLLFMCVTKVFGLGGILEWKPSTNKEVSFDNQKWTVVRDKFGKSHVVFLQLPTKMAKFQSLYKVNAENEDSVNFYLYNRDMKNVGLPLKIGNFDTILKIKWKPEKPLKIIVHGYKVDYLSEGIQKMKNNILDREDANIILVDWQAKASSSYYPNAAACTKDIGEDLAKFIEFLVRTKVSLENVHLIGHSLGAHVCGFAGLMLKKKLGLVGRITGLDPALPNFGVAGNDGRLDSSDAEFVDCIHTCGGLWGVLEPICTSDFYPNGGRVVQPGCHWYDFGGCSHSRAHELFTESFITDHEFSAYTCPSLADAFVVKCVNEGALMGYPASKNWKGIFYLETNGAFPFSANQTNHTTTVS